MGRCERSEWSLSMKVGALYREVRAKICISLLLGVKSTSFSSNIKKNTALETKRVGLYVAMVSP